MVLHLTPEFVGVLVLLSEVFGYVPLVVFVGEIVV